MCGVEGVQSPTIYTYYHTLSAVQHIKLLLVQVLRVGA
jgi:hypothetical protein